MLVSSEALDFRRHNSPHSEGEYGATGIFAVGLCESQMNVNKKMMTLMCLLCSVCVVVWAGHGNPADALSTARAQDAEIICYTHRLHHWLDRSQAAYKLLARFERAFTGYIHVTSNEYLPVIPMLYPSRPFMLHLGFIVLHLCCAVCICRGYIFACVLCEIARGIRFD